jgi:hypothetical protein
LDTKWDIALFVVAIFFAVVLFGGTFEDDVKDASFTWRRKQQESPKKKLEDTKPSKASNNNKNPRDITILPVI